MANEQQNNNNEPFVNPNATRQKKTWKERIQSNPWIVYPILGALIGGAAFGIAYWLTSSSQVYIENSSIVAPTINLGPDTPGVLQDIYVQAGDTVQANETVAQVGNELVKAKVAGTVISVENSIGQIINPGDPLVVMIDPTQLRVVGQLEEDKGLSAVHVGQTAVFSADAFGSQKFIGVVDEISPTAQASDVVFNISDAREEQDFDVYVRYNTSEYPQLLNGMSARIWTFK